MVNWGVRIGIAQDRAQINCVSVVSVTQKVSGDLIP